MTTCKIILTPTNKEHIEEINKGEKLPETDMPVVIDAIGLYDNIPPEEGVKSVGESLQERTTSTVPSGFIMRLMQIILDYSIFEFNDKLYQQQFGTSMGSKPAPSHANNFMARNIDVKFYEIAEKYKANGEIPMKHIERFLDHIFLVFLGTIQSLHMFLNDINSIHPTIKFTMSHTTPSAPTE